MKFSERMGIVEVNDVVQINHMSKELRNSLWNVYYSSYAEYLHNVRFYEDLNKVKKIFSIMWWHYWHKPTDNILQDSRDIYLFIRDYFFRCQWYEVYEFFEATISAADGWKTEGFALVLNNFLLSHLSGYRLIDGKFIPITSKNELDEVQKVLDISNSDKLNVAKIHIQKALELLAIKPIGDFRNSIKESISAVEATCKIIANDQNAELGKSLSQLSSKINIHKGLISGFKSIYGFTSDQGGIRHSLLEESNLDQTDAIYMLVSCSAFINYLIAKKNKAGI